MKTENLRELSMNAWDIGLVTGVIHAISVNPSILPNQKDGIASAIEAMDRIAFRNKQAVELALNSAICHTPPVTPPSDQSAQPTGF